MLAKRKIPLSKERESVISSFFYKTEKVGLINTGHLVPPFGVAGTLKKF